MFLSFKSIIFNSEPINYSPYYPTIIFPNFDNFSSYLSVIIYSLISKLSIMFLEIYGSVYVNVY